MTTISLEQLIDETTTGYITSDTHLPVDGGTHKKYKQELANDIDAAIEAAVQDWLEEKRSHIRRRSFSRITTALRKFLREPRKTDGSHYAPVGDKDLMQLSHIIRLLIESKWEEDCDGDRPIDWRLLDRTKYAPEFWMHVPYWHGLETNEQYREALRAVQSNLRSATEAMTMLMQQIEQYTDITLKEKFREGK